MNLRDREFPDRRGAGRKQRSRVESTGADRSFPPEALLDPRSRMRPSPSRTRPGASHPRRCRSCKGMAVSARHRDRPGRGP